MKGAVQGEAMATALGEAMAGKPVSTASTVSYGCTVKY